MELLLLMISVSNALESADNRVGFHIALAEERVFHPSEMPSGLIALLRCNVSVGASLW